MSLPIEQIKQIVEQTDKDLDIILNRRIYELGLDTLRLYMQNTDEEEKLVDNLLILIETYSKKIDVKTLNLPLIKEGIDSGDSSLDLNALEDNFFFNVKTLKYIKETTTLDKTKSFLNDMRDFYKDNLIDKIDYENEDEETTD